MSRWAVLLSYQGTEYCGWQRQVLPVAEGAQAQELNSVGGVFEAALHRMTSENPAAIGSGRTDTGVHAAGQVVHFDLKRDKWDANILRKGLNAHLPPSIRVLEAREVAADFHAQKSAVAKQYSYYFQQGVAALPHCVPTSTWIRKRLDIPAMGQALRFLEGEHEFKVFQAAGSKPGPTVRRVFETEVSWQPLSFPGSEVAWEPQDWGFVRIRIVGSGFLKQMVRGISGTLLEIGEGRRPATDMKVLLESQDRQAVGATAPGKGLWLERVWYPSAFGEFDILSRPGLRTAPYATQRSD